MVNPLEKHAIDLLEKVRRHDRMRDYLSISAIVLLLLIASIFIFQLIPRHYVLTISGGNILSQRHLLVKLLQDEGARRHLALRIAPSHGSLDALEQVNDGKMDVALVQGGIDAKYPNVVHVATISPELIHFLVKPGINEIKDFKAKSINMGESMGGTRVVAHQILSYSGLTANADYAEKNYSDEDLVGMRPELLPDIIVSVSYAPSDLADFLVKKRGYHLVEMPFPPSLAKRLGWVADTKILGYMYSIVPPVPPKDIQAVGVNLHLVANKDVNSHAIAELLRSLYSPHLQSRFGNPINEADMLIPSGFPVSKGTELYFASKQPFITEGMMDKLKSIFGLVMTLASILAVVWRWFKTSKDEEFDYYGDRDKDAAKSSGSSEKSK